MDVRAVGRASGQGQNSRWRWVSAVELAVAGAAVLLDLWVPTLVVVAIAGVSLLIRRQRPSVYGLVGPTGTRWWLLQILGYAVGWTVFTIGFLIPVLEHLIGERRDVSQFSIVEGDAAVLLSYLAISWVLAALGEEIAYRGFMLTRLRELLGGAEPGKLATVVAAIAVSLVFGLAHREQGVIGVITTFVDALLLTWLRFRYRSLWAAVLAHGFINSIGLVAYYFLGPIHGVW